MGSDYTYTATTSGSSSKREEVTGSFADGLRVGVGLGYEMSPLARFELGLRYEASSEIATSYSYNTTTMSEQDENKATLSQIALVPSLVVAFSNEGIRPYVRVNGHLGFPKAVNESVEKSSGSTSERTIESTGGIAWGFGGGVGIEIPLSGSLSAVGELVADNWTWAPTESEVTKLTEDGENLLTDAPKSVTHVKYVDSYSTSSADESNPDEARKSLRSSRSYSAMALNLGLQMRF